MSRTDRLPWMPFYATDWLLDERVRSLDWEQRGIYFDMLCWQWREGSLPNNVEAIRQILGNQADPMSIKTILATFFAPMPENRIGNRRLTELRREQIAVNEAKARGGKRGRRKQLQALPGESPGLPGEIQTQTQTQKHLKPSRAPARATTWLTPFGEAWEHAYGGQPKYGKLANHLRPLVETHGPETVVDHWKRYLAQTEAAYASPSRFAETFGMWGSNKKKPEPKASTVKVVEVVEGKRARLEVITETNGPMETGIL